MPPFVFDTATLTTTTAAAAADSIPICGDGLPSACSCGGGRGGGDAYSPSSSSPPLAFSSLSSAVSSANVSPTAPHPHHTHARGGGAFPTASQHPCAFPSPASSPAESSADPSSVLALPQGKRDTRDDHGFWSLVRWQAGGAKATTPSSTPPPFNNSFSTPPVREGGIVVSSSGNRKPEKICCMSAVQHEGVLYVYGGGRVDVHQRKVYSIDISVGAGAEGSWEEEKIENGSEGDADAPEATLCHSACVWGGRMWVFGGMSKDGCVGDLHSLPLTRHSRRSDDAAAEPPLRWTAHAPAGTAPSARAGHSAVVHGGRMYIFLGVASSFEQASPSEVHYLDFETMTWHTSAASPFAGPAPCGRNGQSVVLDGDRAVLFGGMSQSSDLSAHAGDDGDEEWHTVDETWHNDVWAYDFGAEAWRCLTPAAVATAPPPRYSHVAWVHAGALFIYGGDSHGCTKYYGDVWRYDLTDRTWAQVEIPGDRPSPRSGAAGVVAGSSLYLFGGERPAEEDEREGADAADDAAEGTTANSNSLYRLSLSGGGASAGVSLAELSLRHMVREALRYSSVDADGGAGRGYAYPSSLAELLPPHLAGRLKRMFPNGGKRRMLPLTTAPHHPYYQPITSTDATLYYHSKDAIPETPVYRREDPVFEEQTRAAAHLPTCPHYNPFLAQPVHPFGVTALQ